MPFSLRFGSSIHFVAQKKEKYFTAPLLMLNLLSVCCNRCVWYIEDYCGKRLDDVVVDNDSLKIHIYSPSLGKIMLACECWDANKIVPHIHLIKIPKQINKAQKQKGIDVCMCACFQNRFSPKTESRQRYAFSLSLCSFKKAINLDKKF